MTHAVASIETSHQLTFQSKQSSLHSKLDSNRSNSYRFSKLTCWFSELGGYWVDVQRLDIFDDPQIVFFRFTCSCVDWRRLQTSQMIGSVNNK